MNATASHCARRALAILTLLLCTFSTARASELLVNGGFENSGAYRAANWDVTNSGNGDWWRLQGTNSPISGNPVPAPPSGNAFMADQFDGIAGSHYLLQNFLAPVDLNTYMLSFQVFVNSASPYSDTQKASVDLLAAGASDMTTNVLLNIFTADASFGNPAGYAFISKDISSAITPGNTYRLRFSEVNNAGYLRMGVDNVSLDGTFVQAPPPVNPDPLPVEEAPEPATLVMMGAGLVGIAAGRKLRARA